MTIDDFEELLDRYGGNPARWPASGRADAEALLRASPEARAAHAAMRDVEAYLLRPIPPARDDDVLVIRAMRRSQIRPARRVAARTGWSAAAAALLLIGFLVGAHGVTHEDDPSLALAQALSPVGIADVD